MLIWLMLALAVGKQTKGLLNAVLLHAFKISALLKVAKLQLTQWTNMQGMPKRGFFQRNGKHPPPPFATSPGIKHVSCEEGRTTPAGEKMHQTHLVSAIWLGPCG